MAKPVTYSGSSVAIYLEDTTDPGEYILPCGLNSHTLTFTKNTQEVVVPDCDNPDLPGWVEREVESLDFSASGEGLLAAEALPVWWAALESGASINARVYVGKPTDTTNGYFWSGKVHVNQFQPQGDRGNKAQVSIGVVSDGEMTFTKVS